MTTERTFYGDCRDDAMFGKPFTDAEVERIRALQAARMRFATSPLPVHSATGADGRWLATVDALKGDLRLATTLLDVAIDAAAQAVIDAKEVYEVRHLKTIRDLRALLKEARAYVAVMREAAIEEREASGIDIGRADRVTGDLLSRIDATLGEGGA